MATWRPRCTSLTDPLRIAEVPAGTGTIGITFCPGGQGDSVFGRPWAQRGCAAVCGCARELLRKG
jgi:hypothetical protein